jgi:hypothetical protein
MKWFNMNNSYNPNEIAKEKIAFYYTREIPVEELNYIQQSAKKDLRLLLICSGGETIIDINNLNHKLHKNIIIDAIDFNPNQLELCANKLSGIKQNIQTGKFEEIFFSYQELLKQQIWKDLDKANISEQDIINYVLDEKNHLKIKNIINIVFSNPNLITIFNEDAVKYSLNSTLTFSEHFFHLFINGYRILSNSSDIDSDVYQQYQNILLGNEIQEIHKPIHPVLIKINYIHHDFYEYLAQTNHHYDLISCSNINDWMKLDKFKQILNLGYKKLNPNGMFIARRLLGDNELKENMSVVFDKVKTAENIVQDGYIINPFDPIGFYTEVGIGYKNEHTNL